MDQNLPRLYKGYGQYSNWRAIPSDIDGLKPVERRVLLSAYKIARSKLVKSRKVDSYTTGNYHPHGACITGETKILLLDGTKVKIKNLVGREMFWVYSCTKDGDIKPGLAHSARMTKKVSVLYRIYLDNESYFDCTGDHLIMLRDGNYKTAKDIVISDSLMPLRTRRKVTKIEILELENEIEVFDLSVDRYHNFAIESGIFVHNCYGTIVQLVRQGFLIGQGNFGSNSGVEPVGAAADRYTECQLHPKTIDLAFKHIKHVPWIDTDLEDIEPLYLPTMFPICLTGLDYTQGIGFGFRTYIPCYQIKDLYQRLLWLLGINKQKPIIAPITDCKILSNNKVLETLLTTGKAKVEVEGVIEINQRLNTLILRSWPPGKKFQTLINKFSQELNDGLIGWRDSTGETSGGQTEIIFEVLRERNRDKIFKAFAEKMKEVIKGFIPFEIIVVDANQNVKTKSVDNMLLDTYKMYSQTNKRMLQSEVKKIDNMISEYKALIKIRPTLADGIFKKLKPDKIIEIIEQQTGITKEITQGLINKYRINKLLTIDIDIPELNNEKGEVLKLLSNLDKFVLEQYNNF